ncbi:hypothetical protein [Paracoccus tegillarcae]|uniref:NfeD family protein n=1 Tax=Paracoccus tegillarcae TaxID=1529068 RepID=A0A2K9EZL7_9RHOB|nr:hypothetical protein [Paracoccus tegillarcae]AUH33552.1 hypothetical protein CUV01_09270 [Paracoccus tegillarcae]
MIWDNGWIWLIAALLLALLELLLPGWIFMGIALATAIMGVVILADLWSAGLPLALVVTALLSGVIWLILRRAVGVREGQVRIWDRDINDDE